ncbi:MAG: hypothetical protein ACLPY1_15160 [Terracidiphilus sp.]
MLSRGSELLLAGERTDKDLELPPKVAMTATFNLCGHGSQPSHAVIGRVSLSSEHRCGRFVARVQEWLAVNGAVFCDEKKDEPVNHAEKLPVEFDGRDMPCAQSVAERSVPWMTGETLSQDLQRAFNATLQVL